MHPATRAFVADIIQNPADDSLRLIYADWLSEHDDEQRAEFIRVQCELYRLERKVMCHQPDQTIQGWCNDSDCPKCGPSELLNIREQELWEANAADWLPYLPGASQYDTATEGTARGRGLYAVQFGIGHVDGLGRVEMLFTRGFVSHIVCTLNDWYLHGSAIVRRHPVEVVEIKDIFDPASDDVFDLMCDSGLTSKFLDADEPTSCADAFLAWAKAQPAPTDEE